MKRIVQLTKWALLCFAMTIVFTPNAKAQSYNEFQGDNYAGINSVYDNPANLADSRYIFDMTFLGGSLNAYNDYFGLQRRLMFQTMNVFNNTRRNAYRNILLNEPWDYPTDVTAKDRFVTRNGNPNSGKTYNLNTSFDVQLLNFMFTFNHDKMGIGFTARTRGITSINGVSQNMADLWFYEGQDYDFTNSYPILNETSRYANANWAEIGLSFGSQIVDAGANYLKGGITLKAYKGLTAMYFITDNVDVKIVDATDDVVLNYDGEGRIMYGVSEGYNAAYRANIINKRLNSDNPYDYQNVGIFDVFKTVVNGRHYLNKNFFKNLGFGMDLGLVYEWRPNYEDYKYDMDGQTGLTRNDLNKYTLKVALSVNDLMLKNMKYTRDAALASMMYKGSNTAFNSGNFDNFMAMSTTELNTAIDKSFGTANLTAADEAFYVKVSPTVNLNVDYRISKSNFFVNLGGIVPFSAFTKYAVNEFDKKYVTVHNNTIINLTPRYERRYFGVSVPVTFLPDYMGGAGGNGNNTYAPVNVGLGFRLGPVWVGSNTAVTSLIQNYWNGVDLCAAVKIPILYKAPKDIDGDGVSDAKDECMYIPGTWELRGCPDTDGDGITDNEDDCPLTPGIPKFNGCPDTDGDGIPDKDDKCPYEPGLPAFQGCPDRDGDGIPDYEDKCPDVPGVKELQGCPRITDRDGDGIPDDEDECPDTPGLPKYHGCPDTDGDGIPDIYDQCPTIPGTIENYGCPDNYRKVIGGNDIPGVNFDTNKDIVKTQYFAELDHFAEEIKACKNPKVHITGHCDTTGNDAINDPLAVRRAESVKRYLVSKGVDPNIITTSGEGSHSPVATNKTKEGRAKNRRVEIEATFK
ncbi:MAG: OmpA family protein [Bacteroidales bacterium]|nr:OmpA family protein [Bacteroidales bacterium]